MKRSQIKPGAKSLGRHSTFAAKPKPMKRPRRQTTAAVLIAGRRAWRFRAQSGPCAICGSRIGVTGHHVIPLRFLKTLGVDEASWYDVANQLRLCSDPAPNRCHDRHELHVARVPRAVVLEHAPRSVQFASDHGLMWLLDREYPEIGRRAA